MGKKKTPNLSLDKRVRFSREGEIVVEKNKEREKQEDCQTGLKITTWVLSPRAGACAAPLRLRHASRAVAVPEGAVN